jgi:hypothetical protein
VSEIKYKQYLITFKLFDGTTRSVPISIPLGEPGENGGYYTPVTEQISDTEFKISFVPSKDGMPAVDPVNMYSFSPKVTVTETADGAEISVTDYLGTKKTTIRHGKNGTTPIKGVDYFDGYTPVKGVDYSDGYTPVKGVDYSDGYTPVKGVDYSDGYTPVKGVDYNDGFSPKVTVTKTDSGITITVTDIDGTRETMIPTNSGNSIYYMSKEVEWPEPEPDDGGIHITFNSIKINLLSNRGVGVKTGDMIVASNGTICKVTSVSSTDAGYEAIGTINGVVESGSDAVGYSTYYADAEIPYPWEYEGYKILKPSVLSNEGAGIKIGDLVISRNGTLAKVTVLALENDKIGVCPLASIAGSGSDSGGYVAYSKAQELTEEQKAQARENIGAQPSGNYLTEVPEGYAQKDDIPTDAEIIQLIKDNAPESSGGGIAVTGAAVGQTVKIAEVDENGVPTAWLPTDFPSGGGGKPELIATFELVPDVLLYEQDVTGYREVTLIPTKTGDFAGAQMMVSGVPIGNNGNGNIKEINYTQVFRPVSNNVVHMEAVRSASDKLLQRHTAVAEWGTIGVCFSSVTTGCLELWGVK